MRAAAEAILFAAGEPVKAAMLAVALDTDIDNINPTIPHIIVLGNII